LEEKEGQVATLTRDLREKGEDVAAWKGKLEETEGVVVALRGELEEKEGQVATLTRDLREKGEDVEAWKGELEETEGWRWG
ncbi:hypothetical protein CLOM_g17069, partial [Closterium sp. NIES-68]